MTLVKWRPIKEFDSLSRYMERLFEDTFESFGRRRWLPRISERDGIIPNVDMYDRKSEIVVKAQLPGVEKENVDITISKDSLTIKGEIKREEEEEKEDYYCSECTYGTFLRTIPLPSEIDTAKAKAEFKNGVLKIKLPKLEEAKAKEVKVKVE